jgi:adenine C2-methylase RlmN of 23S rRNA A2503 and tRNA A37
MTKGFETMGRSSNTAALTTFSYLDGQMLFNTVSRLSKKIRKELPKNKILNQKKVLHVSAKNFQNIKISLESLQYGLELADTVDISYLVMIRHSCVNVKLFMRVVQDYNETRRGNG